LVVPFVFYLLLLIEQEKEDMLRLLRLVPAQAQLHRSSIVPSVGRAVLSVLVEKKRDKKGILCLPGCVLRNNANFVYDFGETIISPYTSFDFFVSQMTRAPSVSV
jgi:hypothetical protein